MKLVMSCLLTSSAGFYTKHDVTMKGLSEEKLIDISTMGAKLVKHTRRLAKSGRPDAPLKMKMSAKVDGEHSDYLPTVPIDGLSFLDWEKHQEEWNRLVKAMLASWDRKRATRKPALENAIAHGRMIERINSLATPKKRAKR